MGVRFKTFGMIGVNLPYGKETERQIVDSLDLRNLQGIDMNDEEWEDDWDEAFHDYFDKKELFSSNYSDDNTGTYKMVFDGMNGRYIKLGLIMCETAKDRPYDLLRNFTMSLDDDTSLYRGVKQMIKSIFGVDVPQEDIKFMVFTHYS